MTYDTTCVACGKTYRASGHDLGFCSVACQFDSLPTYDDVIPSPSSSARAARSYRATRTADNADDAALLLLHEYERLRAALPTAERPRFEVLVQTILDAAMDAATEEEPTP